MTSGCRNCGSSNVRDLGSVGRVAPFFLKRVLGAELRVANCSNRLKQLIRDLATASRVSRLTAQSVYIEMQFCRDCSFIQTKIPFRDDDIMRLYQDYRSSSYNRERIYFEPAYGKIADFVGHDEVEVQNRIEATTHFLRDKVVMKQPFSILDYGGADGRFIPDLVGSKFVYDVSTIEPVPGVSRVHSESQLVSYSLVLLAHVTEHVPFPLELVRKVSEYVRPSGYLYLENPKEISDKDIDQLASGGGAFEIGVHEHINQYSVSAVRRLLEVAGFRVIAVECVPLECGWSTQLVIRALGRKE